jgi:hypothetical protein
MQSVSQVLQTKHLGPTGVLQKTKTPALMLAPHDRGTKLPREYNMRVSTLCQGKSQGKDVRKRQGSIAPLNLGAVSAKCNCGKSAFGKWYERREVPAIDRNFCTVLELNYLGASE